MEEIIEEVVIEVEGEEEERCLMQFVINVERIAKFLLNLQVENPFIVVIVLKRPVIEGVLAQEVIKIGAQEEAQVVEIIEEVVQDLKIMSSLKQLAKS